MAGQQEVTEALTIRRQRPRRPVVPGYGACSVRWLFSASLITQPSRSMSCAATSRPERVYTN
jgi:hypothetical protein